MTRWATPSAMSALCTFRPKPECREGSLRIATAELAVGMDISREVHDALDVRVQPITLIR